MDFQAQMQLQADWLAWSMQLIVIGGFAALLASLVCMLLAAWSGRS